MLLKRLSALLFFLLLLGACLKKDKEPEAVPKPCEYHDQICDSALHHLLNKTQDTIFYGIGTNIWEDTLLPGQEQITKYGNVKVTYDKYCGKHRESYTTHQLSSNWGEWAYNIEHCNSRSAFEYVDSSRSTIKLYDVTEY